MVNISWAAVTATCTRNCFREADFVDVGPDTEPEASEQDHCGGDLWQRVVNSDLGERVSIRHATYSERQQKLGKEAVLARSCRRQSAAPSFLYALRQGTQCIRMMAPGANCQPRECNQVHAEAEEAKEREHENLEEVLVKWLLQAQTSAINIDGAILREKANLVVLRLGINDFKASNRWLDRFKKCNNIVLSRSSEESSFIDVFTVQEW
ncbi:hypothetical protein HPB51_004916 [Rhipicephalus microplus]|uniref:HTH CENPB-type domain-containing protein n=1 Tax=Rhipicephalus microplus TaxID=6941 RepID=A0A9J6EFD6_RHIMP|nr:hypothetical protein HPB51_004916 [Rhipicephalus microplus]